MRFHLVEHGVVDSTSERAFAALAGERARHGDVHVAHGQTAGRGRRGRSWWSEPGLGLYASIVLLPEPPPYSPTALTIATALGVLEGVRGLGVGNTRLDWPNDLVVGDAKLAGVLVESRGLLRERPHYVVGIGLDVRQREFPPELLAERPVTSLALQGVDVSPRAALDAVLPALGRRLEQVRSGHRVLAEDFLAASALGGARAEVRVGKELWRGTVLGLTLGEGIELRLEDGERRVVPLELVRALRADRAREL